MSAPEVSTTWCPLCGVEMATDAAKCPSCGLAADFARPGRSPISKAALLVMLGGLAGLYLATLAVVAVAR